MAEEAQQSYYHCLCCCAAMDGGFNGTHHSSRDSKMQDVAVPIPTASFQQSAFKGRTKKWWFMVSLNILFLIAGQTAATLLGRFYYDKGGNSKWISTFVQTAAFPVLFLALLVIPSQKNESLSTNLINAARPSFAKLAFVYISIGLPVAADDFMYSYGLLYLPVSTYSLICVTQLAFNSVFSYFINAQKFTVLIFNSVVLLTFSAALLGFDPDADSGSDIPASKRPLGIILTLGASAAYSLILSLMQLSFEKVIKKETFSVVLEMQIFTAGIATIVSTVGLFASGEWNTLSHEMKTFETGKVSYVMTLAWTAISWQVASVGVVGLIFEVSSLFSNVVSTLALPIVPEKFFFGCFDLVGRKRAERIEKDVFFSAETSGLNCSELFDECSEGIEEEGEWWCWVREIRARGADAGTVLVRVGVALHRCFSQCAGMILIVIVVIFFFVVVSYWKISFLPTSSLAVGVLPL